MLLDDVGFQSSCRHIVVMTDFDGCDHASLKRYSTESSAGPPESRKHWLHLRDGASLDRISAEAALGWVTSTGLNTFAGEEPDLDSWRVCISDSGCGFWTETDGLVAWLRERRDR